MTRFLLTILALVPLSVFGQQVQTVDSVKPQRTNASVTSNNEFPQYPIQFIGFDGTTYTYRSNNCNPADLHYGILYSATELPTGCNQNGVNGSLSIEVSPDSGNGNKLKLSLTGDKLANNVTSIKFANWLGSQDPYRDYYGGNRDMTAIHLKAQDKTSRYFTLTSSKIGFNGTYYKIPMLILSRSGYTFTRQQGTSIPVPINPIRKLDQAGQVVKGMADWKTCGVYKVTINLPKSATDNTLEPVDCILVLRP